MSIVTVEPSTAEQQLRELGDILRRSSEENERLRVDLVEQRRLVVTLTQQLNDWQHDPLVRRALLAAGELPLEDR